jgi:hypothetical protein
MPPREAIIENKGGAVSVGLEDIVLPSLIVGDLG